MRFELRSLRSESSTEPPMSVAAAVYNLVVYPTVIKTSRHSKLLFFVKNKGQWNAKSGPKVGDGKVAM